MGLLSRWQSRKRANLAADQIFAQLVARKQLEIPAQFSKDSDVAQALFVLRQKYPQVTVGMLHSRSIVLTLGNVAKTKISGEAWGQLDAHGYFPPNELPFEGLLAAQENFTRSLGLDPQQVDRQNREQFLADGKIEVPKLADPVAAAPTEQKTVTEAAAPTDPIADLINYGSQP
jgi:hypothetical protein